MESKERRSIIFQWIFLIVSLLLFVAGFFFYKSIISYLVVAFIFSYILSPVVNFAEKYHVSRSTSILLLYVIIMLVTVWIINVVIPKIGKEATEFSRNFAVILNDPERINLETIGLGRVQHYLDRIMETIPFINFEEINAAIAQKIMIFFNKIPNILLKSVSGIIGVVMFFIVVPVVSFFLLRDQRRFVKSIMNMVPNRYFEFAIHLFERIEVSFGKFFRALLLETALVAFMSVIALLILGIPYALVLGIIVGLANPIKYFGPFIGAIPTVFVILFGPTPNIYLVYMTLAFFIIQQIDGNILFPSLVGKSMNMHPLWVLLTVIAGGYAFGLAGMVFAVPVVFLIKTIFEVSHTSLKEFEII